jgi:hypothetical protein
MIVLRLLMRGTLLVASVLALADKHLGRLDRWNENRKARKWPS